MPSPYVVATVLGPIHVPSDRPDLAFTLVDAIGENRPSAVPTFRSSAVLPTDTDNTEEV